MRCSRLACHFLALLALLAGGAAGAGYPDKPIRLLIPFPPGSASDLIGRTLGAKLSERFGQPVLIDNRPGAGGTIATAEMLKSTADGYTIMTGTIGTHAIAPSLYKGLSYSPLKDLAPISMVANVPLILITNTNVGANNLKELVALVRARPGEISYASPGNGTLNHLTGELFKQAARLDMPHIPYKGGPLAYPDIIAGRVGLMFDPITAALTQVKAGKMKAVVIASARRSAAAPDIPAVAEQGYPGFDATLWIGVFAAAATPRWIVEFLAVEFNRALATPEVREKLSAQGGEARGTTPAEFSAQFRRDIEKWRRVIVESNIQAD